MGDSYWDVFSLEDSHDFSVVPTPLSVFGGLFGVSVGV